jgi:hypothetical protein
MSRVGAIKDERQTFSANVNEVEILLTANYFTSEKYLGEFVASGRERFVNAGFRTYPKSR